MDVLSPPPPRRNWALFLDLDGTLIDIAERPDAVEVPPGLIAALTAVEAWLGGALAIVSGRPMADLDRLLAPLSVARAAEHGAVLRYGGQTMVTARKLPPDWIVRIRQEMQAWPGVLLEEKSCSVAVHYRQCPEYAGAVEQLLRKLVQRDLGFEVLSARMAFEIRDSSVHKGRAVAEFMKLLPFSDRLPVFVGDDVTDEDGFREARAQGGMGLHVKTTFGNSPAHVRAWLNEFSDAPFA